MWSRIRVQLIFLLLVAGFIGLVAVNAKAWYRRWETRQLVAKLAAEAVSFEYSIAALEDRIGRLSNAEELEQEAKARLQLRRPEEKVVVFVPPDNTSDSRAAFGAPRSKASSAYTGDTGVGAEKEKKARGGILGAWETSNARRWWTYFFGTR